ncbi:Glucose-6-phosphate 1-epimerase [Eumeta japonica]|uniref:Galactose mutarotase n=1 Tax=Eumeta variegata TaxID=151549 RepID=A0A4C1SBQ2_EUMVA|nr:Glucose-6-phosphate 1-epimerase [Eumeta japonica]
MTIRSELARHARAAGASDLCSTASRRDHKHSITEALKNLLIEVLVISLLYHRDTSDVYKRPSVCSSKQAVFDGKRAIRGGIPFVFPQFGQWAFGPQHGFARVARWHVEKMPERLPSGDVEAVFALIDNDFTRSMWHFQFRLTYRLILREKELHFNIGVYNPSKELTFSCQLLLHTYFKVPDVRRCQVTGLHGCMFIDKTREGAVYQETREVVTVNEWTDRIYQNTMQEHIITNVVSGRKMRIQKYNFPDTGVHFHAETFVGRKCGSICRLRNSICYKYKTYVPYTLLTSYDIEHTAPVGGAPYADVTGGRVSAN